jgi:hypothetical protein
MKTCHDALDTPHIPELHYDTKVLGCLASAKVRPNLVICVLTRGIVMPKFWKIVFVVFTVFVPQTTTAQSYFEPNRGSETRAALMDAIRPHIEWELGQPIEFVVNQLRVSGAVGYASLSPQRPGGAQIDLWRTPGTIRGTLDPNFMDGAAVIVLYEKRRNTWVAVHHSIGATDVWFMGNEYCAYYGAVIPEFC